MLDLAVAGNPRLAVERIELTLPLPSYTVRTLQALAGREPGNRFTLLLGADAAAELAAWYQVEALPALADVVVFSRPGASLPRHPAIRRVVEVPAVDVSATMIRERVRRGRAPPPLVAPGAPGHTPAPPACLGYRGYVTRGGLPKLF